MTIGCKIGATTLDQSFEEYEAVHRTQGFDEVLERRWPPFTVLETHEHEFHVKALLLDGEMWLTVNGETHHLHAGSTFELDAGLLHAERYGSNGATYWVARRSHS
jgi:quercetin dioxygenase-like cupin family protein